MPYQVLLPVFARDVLGAGSRGLGLLMGAAGLGAVGGALYLAARRTHRRSAPLVAIALAAFGGALVAFAFSRTLALSFACMVVVGAALIVQMATSNTLLQLSAPEHMRGRVISLYLLSFATAAPIGALAAGWIARRVGAPWTVAGGGALCVLAAIAFAARIPSLRRSAAGRPMND
jgi:MFS family permease